ncbi:MAG: phospholipid-binding protein MlaC [Hyphomonadaceae bacterium]
MTAFFSKGSSKAGFTRAGLIAAFAGAALMAAAPAAHAARNTEAEQYVQTNATAALTSLTNRQSPEARQQAFGQLMGRFADVPRIANFVLGRYAVQLRSDAALRTEWIATFQAYSNAVYEDQLDRYRGNAIRVTGSVERVAGRDVIVRTEITPRGAQRPLPVQWRILRSGAAWKVVDVSLVLDGNEIWLAQQQQRDFLAQLDRSRGDIRALIRSVRETTAQMRARINARG